MGVDEGNLLVMGGVERYILTSSSYGVEKMFLAFSVLIANPEKLYFTQWSIPLLVVC